MHENDLKELLQDFILQAFLPGKGAEDLPFDLDLIENGLIDSLALIEVVSFLEDFVGVAVRGENITPDNFKSISTMVSFVHGQ
jgi:acyl carrier protein